MVNLIKIVNYLFPNRGLSLYPLFQLDTKIFSKIFYFKRLYEKIQAVEGDIVECGFGYGKSFQILCLLAQRENRRRKIWGFDSFEGFPEPTKEDESPRQPKKGQWKSISLSQAYKVLEIIFRLVPGFVADYIKITKGFFNDTLPSAEVKKIAFLHLDVDLYESYKTCLEYLFPKVAAGGIVVLDEYGVADSWPGAKKAVDEYFKNSKYIINKDEESGRYYIIKN